VYIFSHAYILFIVSTADKPNKPLLLFLLLGCLMDYHSLHSLSKVYFPVWHLAIFVSLTVP